ncbi:MAG TPA: hypothetical protein VEB40_09460, partial [Flavipsychrobacter sp.]|nr:hypothetical protein [Flavipsychrobacter sp.]
MIYQAAPIIAEALLNSLIVAAICYTILTILLALLGKTNAFIRYHLCNIFLIVPLFIFILSLTKLAAIKDSAPAIPTAPPVAINDIARPT